MQQFYPSVRAMFAEDDVEARVVEGLQGFNQVCLDQFGHKPANTQTWKTLRHSFSHYHLEIEPVHVKLAHTPAVIMEGDAHLWYNLSRPESVGMAAPVSKLLNLMDKKR